MNLKDKSLTEEDYKKYIEHYTFLSRPVFVINNGVYVMEPTKHASSHESIG
jgi:arsenate reductase